MTPQNTAELTLGQLAKRVGLARTSILHYESLGLLTPSGRSSAGYRLYGRPELDRLLTICRLRESGLALADIRIMLAHGNESGSRGDSGPVAVLEKRLLGLFQEVERFRRQQRHLARLLAVTEGHDDRQRWDKESWVALLRCAGFNEEAMHLWHTEFEREAPKEHANFLGLLGFNLAEVARIRRWSRVVTETQA